MTLPSTAVDTAIVQYTSCCAMATGHCLNTYIALAVVHCLSGLFGAVSAVEPLSPPSLPPPPPPPPFLSLISNLTSVDIKQNGPGPMLTFFLVWLSCTCFIPHYLFPGTVAVSGTRVSKHVYTSVMSEVSKDFFVQTCLGSTFVLMTCKIFPHQICPHVTQCS